MSALPSPRFNRIAFIGALALFIAAQTASAHVVQDVRSQTRTPVAPRGGVMMIPLAPARPGEKWPQRLSITLEDGATLEGVVAWIVEAPPRHGRIAWAARPRPFAVRATGDDGAPLGSSAFLLVRVPRDGRGTMRLGSQTLAPNWVDVPARLDPEARDPEPAWTLERLADPSRPDPFDPFAYWRWVLLADRLNLQPPAPDVYGEPGRLLAEHYADLWRAALHRLARLSRGLALECRDLLTHTSTDKREVFASWVTDPAQLNALLSLLLDFQRSDKLLLASVRSWLDRQEPLLVWIESDDGDTVRLAVVNRLPDAAFAKFSWQSPQDIPLGMELTPGVLARATIERPPLAPALGLPGAVEPTRQLLRIECGRRVRTVLFGRRQTVARPPGVFVDVVRPPLTLAQIESDAQIPVPPERATHAHIRRLNRRWEVFFECRRPPEIALEPPAPADDLARIASPEEMPRQESVTLLIGPEVESGGPHVALRIPEQGDWRLFRGRDDGTLEIHRRSYRDRWYARVVLPDGWLDLETGAPTWFGFLRSHADSEQVESAPAPLPPWQRDPSRIAVDLSQWDDLPRPDETPH